MEDIDGLNPEEAVSEDTASEEETPVEQEVDPVAAMAARLDAMEQELSRFKGFDPNSLKAPLGRIPALQSAIDEIKKSPPTADLLERLDLSDRALGTLASIMVNDSEQAESVKAPFRDYLTGVEKARTQREKNALRNELLEEIKPAAQKTDEPGDSPNPWQDATNEIMDEARSNNIDPTTIPWSDIQGRANGSPLRAVRLASLWIAENKTADPSTRVAERRRSAGNGSPSREGAVGTIEHDLKRLSESGIPLTDEAARKRAAAALGVEI